MLYVLSMIAAIPTTILIFGIIVIAMSIFLIIAVLMQQGKQHNISGTIAGAADTFFGKTKGATISKKLSILTSVVAILFVVLVLAFYIVQTPNDSAAETPDTSVESTVDTAEDTTTDTLADTTTDTLADTTTDTLADTTTDTAPESDTEADSAAE